MKLLSKRQALLWAIFALSTALIFQACKKNFETSDLLLDSNIRDAKTWYEGKFPLNSNSGKVTAATQPNGINFTQIITPDWENALTSKRFDDDIFEVPIENPRHFGIGLKDVTNKMPNYKAENSRTTFLLIKNAGGYRAFIMTLIGDDDYLNGDKTKLQKNRYGKHDPNFSGILIYYTPEGKYINHWQYKNGKIVPSAIANPKSSQSTSNYKSQSKGTLLASITACIDYYTYLIRPDGSETPHEYSYSTCKTFYYDDTPDPSNDGTTGSGSGTTGGGTPAPAPPRVDCPTLQLVDSKKDQHKQMVYDDGGAGDTPGDGGFPPPSPDCPTSTGNDPSNTNNATIHNNVADQCLHRLVDAAINRNIIYNLTQSMNSIFGSNTRFNLNFVDAPLPNDTDGQALASGMIGTFTYNPDGSVERATSLTAITVTITLNSATLPNGSEEYVTATILHEALHAYFRATRSPAAFDHYNMVQEYIPWFDAALKSIYPNMDDPDRIGLAYGGLMKDVAFTMGDQNSMRTLYGGTNDRYKSARSGTPCH